MKSYYFGPWTLDIYVRCEIALGFGFSWDWEPELSLTIGPFTLALVYGGYR